MKITADVVSVHKTYADQVGSHAIAGVWALEGLTRWLQRTKPRRVLEVGAGIGTTTTTIQQAMAGRTFEHVALEENEFCLGTLRKNLGDDLPKVTIYPELPDGLGSFGFVFIDGPEGNEKLIRSGDKAARARAARYFQDLPERGVVFVEGNRFGQQQVLREVCPRPFAYTKIRALGDKKGGYHVYQLDPTRAEQSTFVAWEALRRSIPQRVDSTVRRAYLRVRPDHHYYWRPSLDCSSDLRDGLIQVGIDAGGGHCGWATTERA